MRHHVLALLATVATLFAAIVCMRAPAWPVAFTGPAPAPVCTGSPIFERVPFIDTRLHYAHAVSAVMLRDGRLRAVWYQGTKELNPDVRIWTATFNGTRWNAAKTILGAAETAAGTGRYVRKLGNPLLFRDAGGELVLVYAGAGIGGWDGVSLKTVRSRDEGETWSPPRNLTTTPIFNLGTNVRAPALAAAGGFTLIPASHEFILPYPEVVLLDGRGRVVGKRRIGVSFRGSQPFVTVRDERRALALMRVENAFTLASWTDDAGWSWTDPVQTTLRNDDVPVAVTRIGSDLLMIYSKLDRSSLRWSLIFATSPDDGQSWRDIYSHQLGAGPLDIPKYPWLMSGPDGLYHVLFSFSKSDHTSELMHIRLSRDWIAAQGGPPCR